MSEITADKFAAMVESDPHVRDVLETLVENIDDVTDIEAVIDLAFNRIIQIRLSPPSGHDEVVLYESAALAGGAKSVVKGSAIFNVPGTAVTVTIDGVKHTYPMHRIHEIRWRNRDR